MSYGYRLTKTKDILTKHQRECEKWKLNNEIEVLEGKITENNICTVNAK